MLTTAAETFTGPSLTDLITRAEQGRNVNAAITNRMVQALESQLGAGPLADLESEAVTPDSPIAEAQKLELSFEQDVARQLMGRSATGADRLLGRLGQVLDLDGRRVVAGLVSLGQQDAAGLSNLDELAASSRAVVSSLTGGPVHPLGTSLSGLAATTSAVESQLADLAQALGDGTFTLHSRPAIVAGGSPTPSPTDQLVITSGLDRATMTLDAELEAYRASVQAATRVGQPGIAAQADAAIDKLEAAAGGLDRADLATAVAKLDAGIATFDAEVLGRTGVFGPRGAYSRAPKAVNLRPNSAAGLATSAVAGVSGTAGLTTTTDGTATLTATLTAADGSAIAGQTIHFTVDGTFVGDAVTNSRGVATLGGLTTSDASGSRSKQGVTLDSHGVIILNAGNTTTPIQDFGTQAGAVVATFGGNAGFLSGEAAGDLAVGPAPADAR